MVNEDFIMKLPDGTELLIACERNGDNPFVSVTHINAQKKRHKLASVEYRHDASIGRKLYASVYKNSAEKAIFKDTCCYYIKPTFEELRELYHKNPKEQYSYVRHKNYEELRSTSDFALVYRGLLTEDSVDHTEHNITITELEKDGEVIGYAFECFERFGTFYSVYKPDDTEMDSNAVEFKVNDITEDESYMNPRISYLDDAEDQCWELFKAYASYVGVEFGEGIDYSIAKELSVKFISVVERVFGIPFPLSKEG